MGPPFASLYTDTREPTRILPVGSRRLLSIRYRKSVSGYTRPALAVKETKKGLKDAQYPEQHYNQDNRHYKANYSTNSLHALTSPLTTQDPNHR